MNAVTVMTPWLYRLADEVSEVVLYFMVIFYPWAFGTTERWSIWFMNASGYLLGFLLLLKWTVRWRTGYQPMRWGGSDSRQQAHRVWIRVLAILSVVLLSYALVSAWNGRVRFEGEGEFRGLTYLDHIVWLPHSYNEGATWLAFWTGLGLVFSFWAVRDLLLGKSPFERYREYERRRDPSPVRTANHLPERVQRLLWVVCLNAGWLALVAILQRLSGTDRLLWVMERAGDFPPDFSFGPFAYRSNAAQFFNLVWPLALGFWWYCRSQYLVPGDPHLRAGSGPHVILLPTAVLIAAAAVLSGSWGGGWLTLVAMPLAFGILAMTAPRGRGRPWCAVCVVVALVLCGLSMVLGPAPDPAPDPLGRVRPDPSHAEQALQKERTWEMIEDHATLGIGPYAYKAVYQFYLQPGERLYAFAHQDWLQTLVEWGAIGSGLILAALIAMGMAAWTRGGLSQSLSWAVLLSGGVMMIHATFDFPFQIQSLVFVFLLQLALLLALPPQGVSDPTVDGPATGTEPLP